MWVSYNFSSGADAVAYLHDCPGDVPDGFTVFVATNSAVLDMFSGASRVPRPAATPSTPTLAVRHAVVPHLAHTMQTWT